MPELCVRLDGLPSVFVPLPGAPRQPLPIDEVRVSAGFPSPAADYADKRLDINEYGRGALRLAAEGLAKSWQMRRGNLSPRYTTDWDCLARVVAG